MIKCTQRSFQMAKKAKKRVLLRVLKSTESTTQWFTSKSSLVEALLDAVGSAHMEGLGDFLVHETLPVEDVCHHHSQVKDFQQLCDGGDLHQISSALVQTARVQVLKHRLEPIDSSFMLNAYCSRPMTDLSSWPNFR